MAKYSEELKGVVRALYLRRYTPKEIASELNLPNARIVYYWAEKYSWADLLSFESTEEAIERRYQLLASRDNKTDLDLKEMDMLIAHATKLRAQSNKHKEKMASGQSNDQASARDSNSDEPRPKRKNRKNDISSLTQADFDSWAEEHLFEYQKHLRRNIGQQVRNILKSRQIGATWYFAFEAFENAVMTGDPQIFLSASKVQAEYFRSYIVNIAEQYFGITLTGNPIRLSNGAELRFLSTNKNTAQSYSGHLYCDEYFWVPNFARLNEVASAMATHDKWRTTYFSTPSAKTHQAWLCGILAVIFSAYRVAYKPADKAACADAQKKRYSRLLSDIHAASDAEIARRLDELEEFDSNAPTSLYNPARNRASIELRRDIEPLTKFEKLMALLAGGIPK